MSEKIDWAKVEAMADAMTDEDIGLKPGEKMWTAEEGRRAFLESVRRAEKTPGYAATLRKVEARQKAARAMRLMREKAAISQSEVARRMKVKPPAVSRLERFGAGTIQALTEYARACGCTLSIVAKGSIGSFAIA